MHILLEEKKSEFRRKYWHIRMAQNYITDTPVLCVRMREPTHT